MSDRRMQSMRDDRRRDRDDGDRDRRRLSRSRSPAHRGGGRRDDREPDPYSSHRGYREREREDRYGRGGGRGDWDRDRRGGRREGERRRDDRRRDFDDRHDRRGGGRGDDRDGRGRRDDRDHRRDREDERQLEHQGRRGGSRSPARKQKEPTPDLTDFTEIGERTRRLTQWDIKPQGYEKISAEQAKISGMFPLPGAPRPQGQQDPSKNQALALGNAAAPSALKAASARKSKQLFVYNIPPSTTVASITGFFNLQLNGLNVTRGVDPCISASIGPDHSYALVEFKTPEDATTAMAFDGIHMGEPGMANNESNGDSTKGLDIQRPKDYIVPNVTDETENEAGVLSGIVPDSQNKISITNIPIYLTDAQIQELLVSFGELKNFVLVKDTSSDESRGIAFCEYKDADGATAVAVESLNGMELGDSLLKVQRASIGIKQVGSEMTTTALRMMAGTAPGGDTDAGRVICLINMITPQELMDKDEADEILEDVQGECAKYGQILEVKMPRPQGPSRQSDGVGKIYIKYADSASAQKALAALAGRRFADRTVVVMFYGEEYFDVNSW